MTDKKRLAFLQELSEVEGVSGREQEVGRVFKKHVSDYASRIEYDNLGSIIAYKDGQKDEPVIMLSGHIDEVGFLVHRIEDQGYIRFHPIGGWWGHVVLAQTVRITTSEGKKIFGVVGAQPPHGMPLEQRNRVMEIKDMYIDIGVKNKEEVEKLGVRVGDMITPYTPFRVMNDNKTLLGKAWDNRVGAAIAIEVLQNLKDVDHKATVVAAGTVQEEVGLRGARTAAYHIKPDIAFALDVTMSYDLPGAPNHPTKLGAGVALSIMDGSVIAHRGLFDFVEKIAKEKGIKYTYDLMTAGGTDAGEIHKQYAGVVTMTISVPCRYFHSHVSLVHIDDYLEAVKLVTEVVKAIDQKTLAEIKQAKQ
ncbi:MAG: M42 family metallopeptidase [Bacilli bacterium]|jgi:endoglucanase|nr:M42 family metallopeptidase [Bacilli bacterium]NLN80716.1 M42 family metallopeptidase [Erysipelotrichia bacterium]